VTQTEVLRFQRRRGPLSFSKAAALIVGLAANAAVVCLLGLRGFDGVLFGGAGEPSSVILVELEPWPAALRSPRPAPAHIPAGGHEVAKVSPEGGLTVPFSRQGEESRALDEQAPAQSNRVEEVWRVSPTMRDRMAQSLRRGAVGCANRGELSREDRIWCDQRASAAAPEIFGSGDLTRDARFARQGARRMAEVEAREDAPSLVRRSCDKTGPIADCGAEVKIELFSSIRGVLPNIRNRDD
jgi:hypothetical protein